MQGASYFHGIKQEEWQPSTEIQLKVSVFPSIARNKSTTRSPVGILKQSEAKKYVVRYTPYTRYKVPRSLIPGKNSKYTVYCWAISSYVGPHSASHTQPDNFIVCLLAGGNAKSYRLGIWFVSHARWRSLGSHCFAFPRGWYRQEWHSFKGRVPRGKDLVYTPGNKQQCFKTSWPRQQ